MWCLKQCLYTGDFRKVTSMHRRKRRICLDFLGVVFIRESFSLFFLFRFPLCFSFRPSLHAASLWRGGSEPCLRHFLCRGYWPRFRTSQPPWPRGFDTRVSVMHCLTWPVRVLPSGNCFSVVTDTAYPVSSVTICLLRLFPQLQVTTHIIFWRISFGATKLSAVTWVYVRLRVHLDEAGSNTSIVALRVVGGDEKGTQCLGV
jgi:hypothetical protein